MIFFNRLIRCLLLLCMTACSAFQPLPTATAGATTAHSNPDVSATAKIASSLRSVIQRLREAGITAANAAVRHAESYSMPLVQVDHTGSIQTVIVVTTVDDQVESLLEQQQVRIEIADADLRLIQAWIPFERVEHIAALPFVRYIRPPSYAFRR